MVADEVMSAVALRWREVGRVLLMHPGGLGDLLMATPALAAVREGLPGVHLALLAPPEGLALLPHLSGIDEAMALRQPWGAAQRRLRERRFDAAIVFSARGHATLPAVLLCRLAGIRLVLAHARGIGSAVDEVRRQLDLVAEAGLHGRHDKPRLRLREEDVATARRHLAALGVDPAGPYVLMHAGAARVPLPRDAARAGMPLVLCAGAGEAGLLREAAIALDGRAHVLPPLPQFGTLAALVAGARLLVADGELMLGLAAAFGTPVAGASAQSHPLPDRRDSAPAVDVAPPLTRPLAWAA